YGEFGATAALTGDATHRALLNDVLDPARRKLSWFAVHFPSYARWLYSRIGVVGRLVMSFLPMQKPATYSGIREHALQAFRNFRTSTQNGSFVASSSNSILDRLWIHHKSQKNGELDDMAIASECADHFLAGIDTTSDSLMFLVWALSLSENARFQDRLTEEVCGLPQHYLNQDGIPLVEACDGLIFLDAIIKGTLRLYAPLPATEPRSLPIPSNIDSFDIPAGVIVGMSPYSLHRTPEVFKDPLTFNPCRWLDSPEEDLNKMKKWWWAFSSGGRMCIGIHLAMAEMTTLTAAIYRTFRTTVAPGFEGASPGITSRFEVFYDERFSLINVCNFIYLSNFN
ncbi:cytochrome P450, partial [Glonium stellatum]